MILSAKARARDGVVRWPLPTTARLVGARLLGFEIEAFFQLTREPGTFAFREFVLLDGALYACEPDGARA